ncbi:hypothetical protein T05_9321 [Trichinella murrelli]|uniref:Uncharacterized protein n=1 Tax=Trichinella murrelli TaxID=144512 RepID=A0A0V0TBL4_9BILA|nr:hypothetical protein T05_9321 [Trichinella murrelli]
MQRGNRPNAPGHTAQHVCGRPGCELQQRLSRFGETSRRYVPHREEMCCGYGNRNIVNCILDGS